MLEPCTTNLQDSSACRRGPAELCVFALFSLLVLFALVGCDSGGGDGSTTTSQTPPVLAAVGDRVAAEGATLSFDVTASDPDGTIPALLATNLPAGASFTDNNNGTGTFSWSSNIGDTGVYPGIQFIASDGVLSDSEIITITLSVTPTPPVLAAVGNRVAAEGTTLSFDVTASDPNGTTPTLSATNLPTGASFTDNNNGTGTFSWSSNIGDTGDYPGIQFTASDGALNDSETITITLSPTPTAPVLAVVGDKVAAEGDTLIFNVTASDPNGTTPTLSAMNLPGTATFIDNLDGTGTFSWSSNIGDTGVYPGVQFIASDGDLNDSETITITLSPTPTAPVLAAVGNKVAAEGDTLSFDVTASDPNGTTPTLSATNLPTGASFTDNNNGTGTFSWSSNIGDTGDYPGIQFTASDGALNDSETITITLSPTPTAPVLAVVGDKVAAEGDTLIFNVTASDPNGTTPTLSAMNLPGTATFIDNLDGTGTFSWSSNIGDTGVYPGVQFIASDGDLNDSETITITLSPTPTAPVLAAVGDRGEADGTTLIFNVTASDPNGTTPTLSAMNLPGTATFIDNLDGTGTFSWSSNIGDIGVYPGVKFIASDGALSDSETITITLSNEGSSEMLGSLSTPPSSVDLSGAGAADWAHWGLTGASSFDHRSTGGSQISDIALVASGVAVNFNGAPVSYSWSDGVPTVSSSGTTTGIYVKGINNGYEITVPADTTLRTLKVYVGVARARASVEAILSDGSAPMYSDTFENTTGSTSQLVTVNYSAASAGQSLTFRVVVAVSYQSIANVNLQSAMLLGPSVAVVGLPFTDDFSSANLDDWAIIDDSAIASNWQIGGATLTQSVTVESTASFDQSYHLGTYLYYVTSLGLSDYRFSVDASQSGSRPDDIGVLFRYQDSNNYYRFTMNPRYGFSRLEKKVSGVFTTLAANSRGLVPIGSVVTMTVVIQGTQIHILLDGDRLFAVEDNSLPGGAFGLYTQSEAIFDNVSVDTVGSAPAITLSSPIAYSVDTDNTVDATALALNVPAGGYVEFSLDDGIPVVDNTAPYGAQFTGVSQGDHTLDAVLFDAADNEVGRDTNIKVGVAGDYFVAIGDSITNGGGDRYSADNVSLSGRVQGIRGYEAVLTDLLDSNETILPHMVVNEGIGGDSSSHTLNRINSILSRNPDINRANILLGTNDASGSMPVPSGSGCTGALCNGTFKGNMQALIDGLPVGTTASVALIPPAFGSSTSASPFTDPLSASINITVQQYNAVITGELLNMQVGPDLFTAFLTSSVNLFSLFSDSFHPNALGHLLISHLWHNKLNSGNPVATPFTLDNLSPSTVAPYLKQNLLEIGDSYYVDEGFALGSIPVELDGGVWIMTANANKANASASYVSFAVDRSVTVYIAYDAGASSIPDWLDVANGFTATGLTLTVDGDASTSVFNLYSKVYPASTITDLGGNLATGASGADSNYMVIVQP